MRAQLLNTIIAKLEEQKSALNEVAGADVTITDVDVAIIRPPKIVVKITRENVNRYLTGNVSRYDGTVSLTVVLAGNVLEGLILKLLAMIDKLEEILHNKVLAIANRPVVLYLSDFSYDVALEERATGYAVAQVNFEIRR